jgi:hypothetical protein
MRLSGRQLPAEAEVGRYQHHDLREGIFRDSFDFLQANRSGLKAFWPCTLSLKANFRHDAVRMLMGGRSESSSPRLFSTVEKRPTLLFLLIHDPHRGSEAFLLYPCCRDLIGSCIVLVESTLLPCSSEKHALHVGHLAIDGCPPRNVIIRSDQECFATLDLMSMLFLGQIHDLQGDVEDGRPCCELLRNVAVR